MILLLEPRVDKPLPRPKLGSHDGDDTAVVVIPDKRFMKECAIREAGIIERARCRLGE